MDAPAISGQTYFRHSHTTNGNQITPLIILNCCYPGLLQHVQYNEFGHRIDMLYISSSPNIMHNNQHLFYIVVADHFNDHKKYIKIISSFNESLFDSITISITFYYFNHSSLPLYCINTLLFFPVTCQAELSYIS